MAIKIQHFCTMQNWKWKWAKTNITKHCSDILLDDSNFEWTECEWNTLMEIGCCWLRVSLETKKKHQTLPWKYTYRIAYITQYNIDIIKGVLITAMLHAQWGPHVWISLTYDGFQLVNNSNVLKKPIQFYIFTFEQFTFILSIRSTKW